MGNFISQVFGKAKHLTLLSNEFVAVCPSSLRFILFVKGTEDTLKNASLVELMMGIQFQDTFFMAYSGLITQLALFSFRNTSQLKKNIDIAMVKI